MRVTMMVEALKLEPVLEYSDPDYTLWFYDSDGNEIYLGIYESQFQQLKEKIESLDKHIKR